MTVKIKIIYFLMLLLTLNLAGCLSGGKTPEPMTPVEPKTVEAAPMVPESQPVPVVPPTPTVQETQPPVIVTPKLLYAELYVRPVPADARVKVMNIEPKFVQGMKLAAGDYLIEVAAPGHQKYQQWISLEAGKMKLLKVQLQAL